MSAEKWIENLRSQERRLKKLRNNPKTDLINGKPWVGIRDIADQFYCEFKVHLELKFGKRYSKELEEGSIVHSKADSKLLKVDKKKLIEDIVSGKPIFAKFAVDFELDRVPIFGWFDQLFFREAKPCYLLELKSANQNLDKVYLGEKVQAILYAFGLEKMGFDCSSLRLAIVKVRRNLNEENYAKLPMKAINLLDLLQNLNENKSFGYEKIEEYYIHWWKYDGLSEIETELKEKLEYWKKKKSPVKVNNPRKCKSCVYRNECKIE